MPCGSTSRLSKVPPLVADTRASACTVASHEALAKRIDGGADAAIRRGE
jgi:hypothetical protein